VSAVALLEELPQRAAVVALSLWLNPLRLGHPPLRPPTASLSFTQAQALVNQPQSNLVQANPTLVEKTPAARKSYIVHRKYPQVLSWVRTATLAK